MQDLSRDRIEIHGEVSVYSRPHRREPPDLAEFMPEGPDLAAAGWTLEDRRHNLTPTAGKALIARMIGNDADFKIGVTYCELGTSTTAPALADTNIGTVTARNPVGSARFVASRVQWRTFFDAADATADLQAVGIYGHSTASATDQTGELVGHSKIDLDNSSGTKDVTVVYELSIG